VVHVGGADTTLTALWAPESKNTVANVGRNSLMRLPYGKELGRTSSVGVITALVSVVIVKNGLATILDAFPSNKNPRIHCIGGLLTNGYV